MGDNVKMEDLTTNSIPTVDDAVIFADDAGFAEAQAILDARADASLTVADAFTQHLIKTLVPQADASTLSDAWHFALRQQVRERSTQISKPIDISEDRPAKPNRLLPVAKRESISRTNVPTRDNELLSSIEAELVDAERELRDFEETMQYRVLTGQVTMRSTVAGAAHPATTAVVTENFRALVTQSMHPNAIAESKPRAKLERSILSSKNTLSARRNPSISQVVHNTMITDTSAPGPLPLSRPGSSSVRRNAAYKALHALVEERKERPHTAALKDRPHTASLKTLPSVVMKSSQHQLSRGTRVSVGSQSTTVLRNPTLLQPLPRANAQATDRRNSITSVVSDGRTEAVAVSAETTAAAVVSAVDTAVPFHGIEMMLGRKRVETPTEAIAWLNDQLVVMRNAIVRDEPFHLPFHVEVSAAIHQLAPAAHNTHPRSIAAYSTALAVPHEGLLMLRPLETSKKGIPACLRTAAALKQMQFAHGIFDTFDLVSLELLRQCFLESNDCGQLLQMLWLNMRHEALSFVIRGLSAAETARGQFVQAEHQISQMLIENADTSQMASILATVLERVRAQVKAAGMDDQSTMKEKLNERLKALNAHKQQSPAFLSQLEGALTDFLDAVARSDELLALRRVEDGTRRQAARIQKEVMGGGRMSLEDFVHEVERLETEASQAGELSQSNTRATYGFQLSRVVAAELVAQLQFSDDESDASDASSGGFDLSSDDDDDSSSANNSTDEKGASGNARRRTSSLFGMHRRNRAATQDLPEDVQQVFSELKSPLSRSKAPIRQSVLRSASVETRKNPARRKPVVKFNRKLQFIERRSSVYEEYEEDDGSAVDDQSDAHSTGAFDDVTAPADAAAEVDEEINREIDVIDGDHTRQLLRMGLSNTSRFQLQNEIIEMRRRLALIRVGLERLQEARGLFSRGTQAGESITAAVAQRMQRNDELLQTAREKQQVKLKRPQPRAKPVRRGSVSGGVSKALSPAAAGRRSSITKASSSTVPTQKDKGTNALKAIPSPTLSAMRSPLAVAAKHVNGGVRKGTDASSSSAEDKPSVTAHHHGHTNAETDGKGFIMLDLDADVGEKVGNEADSEDFENNESDDDSETGSISDDEDEDDDDIADGDTDYDSDGDNAGDDEVGLLRKQASHTTANVKSSSSAREAAETGRQRQRHRSPPSGTQQRSKRMSVSPSEPRKTTPSWRGSAGSHHRNTGHAHGSPKKRPAPAAPERIVSSALKVAAPGIAAPPKIAGRGVHMMTSTDSPTNSSSIDDAALQKRRRSTSNEPGDDLASPLDAAENNTTTTRTRDSAAFAATHLRRLQKALRSSVSNAYMKQMLDAASKEPPRAGADMSQLQQQAKRMQLMLRMTKKVQKSRIRVDKLLKAVGSGISADTSAPLRWVLTQIESVYQARESQTRAMLDSTVYSDPLSSVSHKLEPPKPPVPWKEFASARAVPTKVMLQTPVLMLDDVRASRDADIARILLSNAFDPVSNFIADGRFDFFVSDTFQRRFGVESLARRHTIALLRGVRKFKTDARVQLFLRFLTGKLTASDALFVLCIRGLSRCGVPKEAWAIVDEPIGGIFSKAAQQRWGFLWAVTVLRRCLHRHLQFRGVRPKGAIVDLVRARRAVRAAVSTGVMHVADTAGITAANPRLSLQPQAPQQMRINVPFALSPKTARSIARVDLAVRGGADSLPFAQAACFLLKQHFSDARNAVGSPVLVSGSGNSERVQRILRVPIPALRATVVSGGAVVSAVAGSSRSALFTVVPPTGRQAAPKSPEKEASVLSARGRTQQVDVLLAQKAVPAACSWDGSMRARRGSAPVLTNLPGEMPPLHPRRQRSNSITAYQARSADVIASSEVHIEERSRRRSMSDTTPSACPQATNGEDVLIRTVIDTKKTTNAITGRAPRRSSMNCVAPATPLPTVHVASQTNCDGVVGYTKWSPLRLLKLLNATMYDDGVKGLFLRSTKWNVTFPGSLDGVAGSPDGQPQWVSYKRAHDIVNLLTLPHEREDVLIVLRKMRQVGLPPQFAAIADKWPSHVRDLLSRTCRVDREALIAVLVSVRERSRLEFMEDLNIDFATFAGVSGSAIQRKYFGDGIATMFPGLFTETQIAALFGRGCELESAAAEIRCTHWTPEMWTEYVSDVAENILR